MYRLDDIKHKWDIVEEMISKLEEITIKTMQNKTQRKEFKKMNINELWENFQWPLIVVMEILKGEKREGWERRNI